jgi:hypothetical protein
MSLHDLKTWGRLSVGRHAAIIGWRRMKFGFANWCRDSSMRHHQSTDQAPSQRSLFHPIALSLLAMMKVAGCILLSLSLTEAFAPSSLGFGTRKMTSQLSMAAEGAEPVLNKYSRYVMWHHNEMGCYALFLSTRL